MAQLIATTNIDSVRLICLKGTIGESYKRKYVFLKRHFGTDAYRLFARPEFKSNEKINWYTDFEGKIYSFSKAQDVVEDFQKLIEHQITNLYTIAINLYGSIDKKREIVSELDNLLTIQSIDDIYLIISDDNTRNICITNWCQGEKKQVNPVAGLFNPKAVNVTLTVRRGKESVGDYKVWIKIDDETRVYVTDKEGKIVLEDIELLSSFTVIQKSEDHVINTQTFVVDRQSFFFDLRLEKSGKVQLKAVDHNNKPLSNIKLEIAINGKQKEYSTDNQGVIELGEIEFGSEITVEQKVTGTRKIVKTYVVNQDTQLPIIFRGDKGKGNYLVIKVLDANGQPFVNAQIEVWMGDRRIKKETNKDGILVINDLLPTETIIVKHLVDGRPVSQKTIEYDRERFEIVFRSHVAQKVLKDITIKLRETQEQPIMNLSVKLATGSDWQHCVTDANGYAFFEKVDCNDNPRIEFIFRRKNYSFDLDCTEQTNFEFVLSQKKKMVIKKSLLYLLILSVFLVLGAVVFLLYKPAEMETHKQQKQAEVDTAKVQQPLPKFKPYKAKVYVLYSHDRFPVNDVTVYLKTDTLEHELRYDSGYFAVDVKDRTPKSFDIFIGNKDTIHKRFVPARTDTIWVKIKDLKIANDTGCGVRIYEHSVHTYIQTFRYPHKVSKIHFRFNKMFHSDFLRIYEGPKETIGPQKVVKEMRIFSDTARYIINLPYPDSLVTFEIEAGEPNFPAWKLTLLCK